MSKINLRNSLPKYFNPPISLYLDIRAVWLRGGFTRVDFHDWIILSHEDSSQKKSRFLSRGNVTTSSLLSATRSVHTAFPHQNSIHSIHPRTKGKENLSELDKNRDIFLHRLAIWGEDEASVFVTEKKKKEKEKMKEIKERRRNLLDERT